jgi:signal transduction histidine kinase
VDFELLHVPIDEEGDVFALRNQGRQVAALIGFDQQDEIRIATALSEVGREALEAGGGTARFVLQLVPESTLFAVISTPRRLPAGPDGRLLSGLLAAQRLMDGVEVTRGQTGTTVRLQKRITALARPQRADVPRIRAALATATRASPLDELRSQNRDLVATLEQLTAKQSELLRLNGELEETNLGVMAMYGELSGELEETNRGVVALYAELDEKTLQLQQAGEAKSRFFSSVSHELRSPVNSVIALAKLLVDLDADPLTDDQRRQVDLIGASAAALLSLVNGLLDVARAEAGKLEAEPVDIHLAGLFGDLRGTMRPLVPEGVDFTVESPAPLPSVETDPVLLGQVLRNLLSNSMKFTERGQVSLSARLRESGQHVEIVVADTGIGIAPEDQEKVFEEFFQVRGPLQARRRGSGLGLPYVRRLVEVLGGDLEFESAVGAGTSVTIRLPLRWSSGMMPTVSPGAAETAQVDTVLVVDDDQSFREVLRGMLQGVARRVIEAADGADALVALREHRPDIVFLDLRMPVLDGAELLARMSEDPSLRSVPAVILTSMDLDARARTRLGGAAAMVAKSNIDKDRLQDVLVQVLGDTSP